MFEGEPRASRVLVTDGDFKHSLGIVRTLAARGHEVHLIAPGPRAPAAHSHAVREWHPLRTSPGTEADQGLFEIATRLAPLCLLPVGDRSVAAASRLRGRWPQTVRLALPPPESLEQALDKVRSAALARSLGLSTPREQVADTLDHARQGWERLGTPLVVKSRREAGRKIIRYVRRAEELEGAYAEVRRLSGEAPLLQEYVGGDGFGYSALYWEGKPRRRFMHRRIREWPPSGGTSACAESVLEEPELERAGSALLDALRWHGVAMAEFKRDVSGTFRFLEINPKFWGSHDLALAAGVDFPGDLVTLLEGRELPPQLPYRRVRFSWPLGGDLWHGLSTPSALPRVLWDALSPAVAHSCRWSDPAPHFYELIQWLRSTPGAWRERRETR